MILKAYQNISERKVLFRWFNWFVIMKFIAVSVLVSRYLQYAGNVDSLLAKMYIPLAITSITRHTPLCWPLKMKKFLSKHGFIDLADNWGIMGKMELL